jgi:two-component system LytT family response regulator
MSQRVPEDEFVPGPRIRTLIVDDEPLARENLRIRLRDVPDFEIVGECATGRDAIGDITALAPDVVFLDIQMPDMDGLSVVEQVVLERPPIVVFVTAYDRYAVEAFRLHALDYLLKPFEEARFTESLRSCRGRVREIRELEKAVEREPPALEARVAPFDVRNVNPYRNRLVVKGRGRVFFLRTESIDWVEACADYVSLHAGERTWLIRRTLTDLEGSLDPQSFVRVSRSAIVNLDRVQELMPAARGEYTVRLAGGQELKLTRGYRERLEALLGDRL